MRIYDMGMDEEYHAQEMALVRQVFKRSEFWHYKTIEDWIEDCIHPAFVDDALKLVERLRKQKEGQAK